MKYYLLILSLLCAVFCEASDSRPLVIELNSGDKIIKSPCLIDSITFDVVSLDSAGIPIPIQQIWEGGKSTDIITSDIKSVDFISIPTVYQKNVVLLENDIYNSLISCINDSVLYFNHDIIKHFIPSPGIKLATLQMSEKLPMGFMGQIEEVAVEDGQYKVTCERVWYPDIFESFYGVFDTQPLHDANDSKKALDIYDGTIQLPEIKHKFEFSAGNKLDEDEFFGAAGEITVAQESRLAARTAVLIEPGARMSVSCILTNNCDLTEEFSLCHKISYNKSIPIVEKSVKIPVAPLLQVYFSGGIDFEVEGQIGVKASVNQKYKVINRLYISNYDIDTGDNNITIVPISNEVDNLEAFGKIELGLALYGEIGIAIAKPGIADIGFKYSNGVKFKLDAPITRSAIENASRSTELYELLTGRDNISLSHYSASAISSDLLKTPFWKLYLSYKTDDPFLVASLLPTFRQFNLNTKNENNELQLEGQMKRSLFSGTPRLAIFEVNEDGSKASDYSGIADFTVIDDHSGSYTSTIRNASLLSGRDYITKSWVLNPVISLFGHDVLATPEVCLDNIYVKASKFKVNYKNSAFKYNKKEKKFSTSIPYFIADVEINNLELTDDSNLANLDKSKEWGICVRLTRHSEYFSSIEQAYTNESEWRFKALNNWRPGDKLIIEDLVSEVNSDYKYDIDIITGDYYLTWGLYNKMEPRWDGDEYSAVIYPMEKNLPISVSFKPLLNFTDVSKTKSGYVYTVRFKAEGRGMAIIPGFTTYIIPWYVYNWNHRGWNSYFTQTDIYHPEPKEFMDISSLDSNYCYALLDGEFSGSFRVSSKGCLMESGCEEIPRGVSTLEYSHSSSNYSTEIYKDYLTVVFCPDYVSFDNAHRKTWNLNAEHIYCEMRKRYKITKNKISGTTTNTILSDELRTHIRRRIFPITSFISGNHVEYQYVPE